MRFVFFLLQTTQPTFVFKEIDVTHLLEITFAFILAFLAAYPLFVSKIHAVREIQSGMNAKQAEQSKQIDRLDTRVSQVQQDQVPPPRPPLWSSATELPPTKE